MQRPAELVPIPEYLLSASLVPPVYFLGISGKFAKFPRTFRQNLATFWKRKKKKGKEKDSGKFAKILKMPRLVSSVFQQEMQASS